MEYYSDVLNSLVIRLLSERYTISKTIYKYHTGQSEESLALLEMFYLAYIIE